MLVPERKTGSSGRAGEAVPFWVGCQVDTEAVVVVAGEVDVTTSPQMAEAAKQAVGLDIDPVIFDLRRVTYFDSSGMGVIVQTARDLHAARRPRPEIRHATGLVRISLGTVGLGYMFAD